MSVVRSFDLKLGRAKEHFQRLDTEADIWLKTEPWEVVDEHDPEALKNPPPDGCLPRRQRVVRIAPVPNQIGLMIGDCLFNLRSALDHLALALAKKNTPGMSDKQVVGSEFPIFHNIADYAKVKAKKIGCVAPGAEVEIESLQPYHLRSGKLDLEPLWLLNELNRIDKHRHLHVCAAATVGAGGRAGSITISPDTATIFNCRGSAYFIGGDGLKALHQDGILLRWGAIPVDGYTGVDMKLKLDARLVFANGHPIRYKPVAKTLGDIISHVEGVVFPNLACHL